MAQVQRSTHSTRRPRNSLTVEAILDAGERVATSGFAALTIRAVASELESSPMSLYRYFATKEELVDALLNRVLGRFRRSALTADWLDDLRTFASDHRALLMAHPWAVSQLIGNPYPGPNAAPIGEQALTILARAGITGDAAVATFSGIVALNYGWVSFAIARDSDGGRDAVQEVVARSASAANYPLTDDVSDPMSRYASDEHYETVQSQLLFGVKAMALA